MTSKGLGSLRTRLLLSMSLVSGLSLGLAGQGSALAGSSSAGSASPAETVFVVIDKMSPNFGPSAGGNTVTIRGRGLITPSSVTFGSTPAHIVFANRAGTLLRVKPGTGTGSVDVQVKVENGATSPTALSAYAFGPLIKKISPAVGPAGGGNTITITGQNLANPQKVEFLDPVTLTPVAPAATSFIKNTKTSIKLSVPAPTAELTPGGVIVRVTGPDGSPPAGTNDLTSESAVYAYGVRVTKVSPNVSRNGGKVVISGSGFTSGSTVRFGSGTPVLVSSTKGSPAVVNPKGTTITLASVPTQAAGDSDQVDVIVTSGSVSSPAVSSDKFSYGAAITGLSPTSGPPAGGTRVVIHGKNLQHVTSATFGTTPVTVSASNINRSGTAITLNTPAHANGIVGVTVTDPATGTTPVSSKDTFAFY